jgi:hypothetical protein
MASDGPAGPTGSAGPAGTGVPSGGSTGQALVKSSASDYDTQWTTLSTTPSGAAGGSLSGTYPNPSIANQAVTYAKIQDVEVSSLLGRANTAGNGVTQEIKLSASFVWGTVGGKPQLGIATVSDPNKADASLSLSAGTGLTGGGDLSTNRSFAVDFATSGTSSSTKAVRADDSRLSDARTPTAHVHTFADISSVAITSVADKELLQYSSSSNKWINVPQTDLVDGGNF